MSLNTTLAIPRSAGLRSVSRRQVMIRRAAIGCVLTIAVAAPLHAQEARGRIAGAESATHVNGAFVILLDSTGATVTSTLSNERGQYVLQARKPGTYSMRVERLGLASHTTDPIVLAPGDVVVQDITVREAAVTLAGITASAERSGCNATGDLDDQTAAVWEEARKALSVAAWTARQGPLRLHIVTSLTERYAGGNRVMFSVDDGVSREMRGSPWNSAPAEDLVRLGFVRAQSGGYLYYGPDAEVLLSDVFLAGHCYTVVQHQDSAHLVGLEFRPRGRPAVTDIRGTLWLQREPAELRSLDYRYERLPFRLPRELARETIGGTARYMRLESGMWILAGWTLSAPRPHVDEQAGRGVRQVLLMSEHSARVVRALDSKGQLLHEDAPSAVLASGDTADTHPEGDGNAAATPAVTRPDDIPFPGGSMPARLWVAQRCGGTPKDERMHIVGVVGDAGRRPVAGSVVTLTTLMQGYWEDRRKTPDADGRYWFCNVPGRQPYEIEAAAEGYESVKQTSDVPTTDVAGHQFTLMRD
jgi:hypothetical protein